MIDRIHSTSHSSQLRTTSMTEGTKEFTNEKTLATEKTLKETNLGIQDKDQIEEIVQSINDFLIPTHTSLKFEFHEKLNEYYVTIVDDKTRQVVKEIPSKKMLDFYASMTEFIGVMVDRKI